ELAKKGIELEPEQGLWWNTLGAAQYRAGNWAGAIAALEKSTQLRKGGDGFDWFYLAMAHWQLSHKDEAREWRDRAVAWMDQQQAALQKDQRGWEELNRMNAEAAELLEIKK